MVEGAPAAGDAPSPFMPFEVTQSDGSGNPRKLSKRATLWDTTLEMTDSGLDDLRGPCHCTPDEPRCQPRLVDLGAHLPAQLAPTRIGIAHRLPCPAKAPMMLRNT
jgi:hypothetical protein